jgi:hypothetical protein
MAKRQRSELKGAGLLSRIKGTFGVPFEVTTKVGELYYSFTGIVTNGFVTITDPNSVRQVNKIITIGNFDSSKIQYINLPNNIAPVLINQDTPRYFPAGSPIHRFLVELLASRRSSASTGYMSPQPNHATLPVQSQQLVQLQPALTLPNPSASMMPLTGSLVQGPSPMMPVQGSVSMMPVRGGRKKSRRSKQKRNRRSKQRV